MSSLASKYGSCRELSEFLLQSGDGWKYPQWHINFIRGISSGREPLARLTKSLLESLSDGKWHVRLPETPRIGVGTIEACDHLKLIEIRNHGKRHEDGGQGIKFRITKIGKEVLTRNSLL